MFSYASVKIDIRGVDSELRQNIELNLSLSGLKSQKNSVTRTTINRLVKKVGKEVSNALQPFGYYSATASVNVTNSEEDTKFFSLGSSNSNEQHWHIEIDVDLGPRVKIKEFSVNISGEGAIVEALKEMVKEAGIKKGDGLNHAKYKDLKKNLLNTAQNAGYVDAKYQLSEIRVDTVEHTAYIFLTLDIGPLYYFGDINIEQDVLNENVIDRYIRKYEGEAFAADKLLDLKFALSGGGYFNNVDVDVRKENAKDYRIPIDIATSPAPRFSYTGSLGYGTDTGPRVGAGFVNRRVNARGHKLKSNIRWSEKENSFVTQYKIPTGNMVSEYYDVKFMATEQEVNDVDSIRYAASTSHNIDFLKGSLNYSLTVVQEDFEFRGEELQRAQLLIPGVTYSYVKSDNPLYTRKGYSFIIDIHGGLNSAYSETTFLHVGIAGNAILPLGNRMRLLLRGEQGRVFSDDFNRLPPSERFFTGGVSSVRGFGYQDIGPRNDLGVNLGGKTLVIGSAELDYLLTPNWGVAVFTDAGNATNEEQFELYKSYGVGLRYKTPIGMVRFDIAHPVDKLNEGDKEFKIHLNIGPDL
ncbi:Translocation and assembly module TamA [Thalassocella blandensis]|nr:Translocation and assembly module TamA [Thalassocella blandensis]